MNDYIPYSKQNISKEDINKVVEVLKSDFLTQGPMVPIFEKKIAEYCSVSEAVAFNSATSSLHAACASLGLGKGDLLWTSPNSFVASANCAIYCGADVDFVDIDPETFNISTDILREKLKNVLKGNKKLPKVIIPVHIAGQSCQMREIKEIVKPYDIKIIEDASHAIGGEYESDKIGCCKYSDITVFSFHPVKIITSAEGGAAVTQNKLLANRMRAFRTHGITRDKSEFENKDNGDWYYEQKSIGYNYRLNDIQATLGISQINRIDKFVSERNDIAEKYNKYLANLPLSTPIIRDNCSSSFHLYIINLNLNEIKKNKKDIFEYLRTSNIGVNIHYIPIHYHPFYAKLGFKRGDFPNAERYYNDALSIPVYPGLTDENMLYVTDKLKLCI